MMEVQYHNTQTFQTIQLNSQAWTLISTDIRKRDNRNTTSSWSKTAKMPKQSNLQIPGIPKKTYRWQIRVSRTVEIQKRHMETTAFSPIKILWWSITKKGMKPINHMIFIKPGIRNWAKIRMMIVIVACLDKLKMSDWLASWFNLKTIGSIETCDRNILTQLPSTKLRI